MYKVRLVEDRCLAIQVVHSLYSVCLHFSACQTKRAVGYSTAETVAEEVMEMIDREADGSDSLEVSAQIRLTCS